MLAPPCCRTPAWIQDPGYSDEIEHGTKDYQRDGRYGFTRVRGYANETYSKQPY